jgi:DNA repair protein RadC
MAHSKPKFYESRQFGCSMSVKALPPAARPREKLLARGDAALSDAELLAIVLRTGIAGLGVLQMAQNLLDSQGGLRGLLQATPDQLKAVKGLGPAKRAELMAVLALARRAMAQGLAEKPVFNDPKAVLDYCQLEMGHLPSETFALLLLDVRQRLIAFEPMFKGTLDKSAVYPRDVAVKALAANAASVVAVHNHPSGDLTPSNADRAVSRQLDAALALLDIRLLDHIIVGPTGAVSMAQMGGWH